MSRLSETPTVHETATVVDCTLGRWTEVKARVSLREVAFGDYSYIVSDSSAVWATVGKFCSIARRVRINPGNHATWRASQHHFTCRAAAYDLGEDDDGLQRAVSAEICRQALHFSLLMGLGRPCSELA